MYWSVKAIPTGGVVKDNSQATVCQITESWVNLSLMCVIIAITRFFEKRKWTMLNVFDCVVNNEHFWTQ